MSNGHLNVYSSSGQMDISKCPSDIWICPLVQWTNGHIEMSIGHLNVQSSNGRMDMSNASITCKHISAWFGGKRGYADMRICGYADMRVCGYAGMRICGYTGMRICGYAGTSNWFNKQISKTH